MPAADVRFAYAVRPRRQTSDVFDYTNAVTDDAAGVYVPPVFVRTDVLDGVLEPDLPPGFPGTHLVYRRTADGQPLSWDRGPASRRGEWWIVTTVVTAGAAFDATYPADNTRVLDPNDYVNAGDAWDYFDVTRWAIDGAMIPGRMKGVGS